MAASARAGACSGRADSLLILTILSIFVGVLADDYCALNPQHTMCKYQGIGPQCGYGSRSGRLTESEKQSILNTHNRLRSRIASGQEAKGSPGPQPPAVDMQYLHWDDELATIAQRWADQCIFEHDDYRNSPRFSVGQNLFLSEGGVPWDQAIYSWYSEVEFFDKNLVDNFVADSVTGHFTQLAWGNTRFIGCAKRTYPQKKYRYKRETGMVDFLERFGPENVPEDGENPRQARNIDNYNGHYSNRNNYNWDAYLPKGKEKEEVKYDEASQYDSEWKAYNKTLHQYYEKYKNVIQNNEDYKARLKEYKDYLSRVTELNDQSKNYKQQMDDFNHLYQKYEDYKKVQDRLKYYEQKQKAKVASKKKLNPVINTGYSFSTEHPIIAGVEFEYYVCNYGPSGNYQGARMYTKGQSQCPYYGLCNDPLTKEYYPSLEEENDPILASLYYSQET